MSFYPRPGPCEGYVPTETGLCVVYSTAGGYSVNCPLAYVLVAESDGEVAVRIFQHPSKSRFQEMALWYVGVEIALPQPLGDRVVADGGASFRPLLPRYADDLPATYHDWTAAPTQECAPLGDETRRWRVLDPGAV